MNNPLILITGATGKTGAKTVEILLEQGYRVRALARKKDERSERLLSLGAEVVFGDFHDLGAMREAVEGVERAYFCYPPQGTHLVDATAIFAIAARDAGVTTVVNMSQITAREDAPSPLSRQHWLGERVLDWAGVGAVHVNPTFFAENLFMLGGQTVAAEGKLYGAFGDESHAPVAAGDIARVVAEILVNPDGHAGQRYVLTGPTLMSHDEMAAVLGDGLGLEVTYVDLPVDRWTEAIAGVPGMNQPLSKHLGHVAQDHRDGVFRVQNDLVERVTGSPAQALAAFIEENKGAYGFTPASA